MTEVARACERISSAHRTRANSRLLREHSAWKDNQRVYFLIAQTSHEAITGFGTRQLTCCFRNVSEIASPVRSTGRAPRTDVNNLKRREYSWREGYGEIGYMTESLFHQRGRKQGSCGDQNQ